MIQNVFVISEQILYCQVNYIPVDFVNMTITTMTIIGHRTIMWGHCYSPEYPDGYQDPLLLTWFNFNLSMDK